MNITEENYLAHYGVLRRSGRYPWGSGGPEKASNKSFLDYVSTLRKQGLSDPEIAQAMGINTTQLRAARSIASNEERQAKISQAQKLKDKGYSNIAIGERMGIPESSVRSLLDPGVKDRAEILAATSNMLRDQVQQKNYLDVGTGAEQFLGLTRTKLNTAISLLEEEGYKIHYVKVPQLGTNHETTLKVLAKPGVTYSEVFKNRDQIKQVADFSEDGGRTFLGIHEPLSISSKRIAVKYAEEGGTAADGVIYVRPGVKDVSIGQSRYAQVRIKVDGTHYLKGMAVYKDDLPPGVDLMFNTNKSSTGNKLDAMKKLKDDPDNPFGSTIHQIVETGANGKTKVTSAMNIVGSREGFGVEGSWDRWTSNLSSQFLSKQSPTLAKSQLEMTFERRKKEFDEIMALTNPVVKKKLLESFADGVDSSAVHLEAAALPRTVNRVILPINSLKENEIYSPSHNDGEKVVLVRHPHGGTFEIPELVVNNRNAEAKKTLGRAQDAVGIHHKVAERLSGADFDGDTVLVIPNNQGKVKTTPALVGLKNFDAKASYPAYEGMPKMTARTKQIQMGDVSNLITDMTLKGANTEELARAVRHSMVVIDAEKHNLDYKRSARENGIPSLKEKYQGGKRAGASTLISKAGSEQRVAERKQGFRVDPATGKKIFTETGKEFTNKDGKLIRATTKSTKMAEADDAHTLSSGTRMETVYANHANRLKSLANEARKSMVNTKNNPQSPSAKAAYRDEVATLEAKLSLALRNRPLERQAQLVGNATVAAKRAANPDMDAATLKKIKSQSLEEARRRTNAQAQRIDITEREWEAIQAGAISNHKLSEILKKADLDQVKKYATPKTPVLMTSIKRQRAQSMLNSGYTQAEVANALGVSLTTLKTSIGGEG